MEMFEKICEVDRCTGCGVCVAKCPVEAIRMEYNKMGALIPTIDKEKCVGCKACKKICPTNNKSVSFYNKGQKAYYSKTMIDLIYNKASSGGIATAIGCACIANNGVVYGAVMNPKQRLVKHERMVTLEELYTSQGSKYVQSYLSKEIYESIKRDVDDGREVVVIGTPCQIAGVKKYMNDIPDNLFLIDLVCHGVPGTKVFQEYMDMEVKNEKISQISFRDKTQYNISLDSIGGKGGTPYTSIYYHGFMTGSIYRQSCHTCQYARRERVADITLGDTEYSVDGKVFSSVIIYSEKGRKIYESLENKEDILVSLEEMLSSHKQLNEPVPVCKEQKRFVKLCEKKNIKYALKYMNYRKTILIKVRRMINRCRIII